MRDNSKEGGTLLSVKSSILCFSHKGKGQVVIDCNEKVVFDLESSFLAFDFKNSNSGEKPIVANKREVQMIIMGLLRW